MIEKKLEIRMQGPGFVDKLTTKAAETFDEFVFETISEWATESTKLKIEKDVMLAALTNYMKPAEAEMEGGGTTWWYVCGECHGDIDTRDSFCRHCGRRISWKGCTL